MFSYYGKDINTMSKPELKSALMEVGRAYQLELKKGGLTMGEKKRTSLLSRIKKLFRRG
jgi:hypothetical protein